VRRHFLRVFERAAIGKLGSDTGRAERVIADRRVNAGGDRAPADHAPLTRNFPPLARASLGVAKWNGK
jgi:hypothetical protein